MAIRPILRMGAPVLRAVAAPVADVTAPAIRALADDMLDTMAAAGGRGLAAPQIGVSLRLVMFWAPLADPDSRSRDHAVFTILANPVLELVDPVEVEDWEGCLSVPGLAGRVPRARGLRYRGLDLDGAVVDRLATGFHARVVAHECDHLDGILYPQRMTDLGTLRFLDAADPVQD